MDRYLHIVALDIPYPVRYGGVYDLYYKLEALWKEGVRIRLHCFGVQTTPQPELEKYCEEVHYYPRKKGWRGFSFLTPYIVNSRSSEALMNRLLQDNHPILLEGIHCCQPLQDKRFDGRKIVVRLHNVEYAYYQRLFFNASFGRAKMYYLYESILLKRMEALAAKKAALIIAVAENDMAVYRRVFKAGNIVHLPVFIGFSEIAGKEGLGAYCLYHGNLSVPENEKAAIWLLQKVFNDLSISLVIAGKDPAPRLTKQVSLYPNARLMANPSEEEMSELIAQAQIHILPSFNNTGIKLKLLNALYNGRHCVVNPAMIAGTGFEPACHAAGNAAGFKSIVTQLYNHPFAEEEILLRKKLLPSVFDNRRNALRLIQWLW